MRRTRVLSVALDQADDPGDRATANREAVFAALDQAATYDPDFVCFPETVLQEKATGGHDDVDDVVGHRIDMAEPVGGPVLERVGRAAADLDSHVVLPTLERDGDACYNSSVLFDPAGDVVDAYHKVRPPLTELRPGVTPGTELPVWETEFGRVGALVCFDLMYPELGVELQRNGAALVFFSSQFDGNRRVNRWAREYGFHVVRSTAARADVVTPTGETVSRVGTTYPAWVDLGETGARAQFACAEVNTDCKAFATATSGGALAEIQRNEAVSIRKFDGEGHFLLTSLSPTRSVADIECEYDLEGVRDYLDRTADAARETLAGREE